MNTRALVGLLPLVAVATAPAAEWEFGVNVDRAAVAYSKTYADSNLQLPIDDVTDLYSLYEQVGPWSQTAQAQLPDQGDGQNLAFASHESTLTNTSITASLAASAEASARGLGDPEVLSAEARGISYFQAEIFLTEPIEVRFTGSAGSTGGGWHVSPNPPKLMLYSPDIFYEVALEDESVVSFDERFLLQPPGFSMWVSIYADPGAAWPDIPGSSFSVWADFSLTIVPAPTSAALLVFALPVHNRRRL
jgi:hypothetical protein